MRYDVRTTVLEIYDAAADATLWPSVLQRIADRVDAVGCIVFEWTGSRINRRLAVSLFSEYYDREQIEIYLQRCATQEIEDQDRFEAHSLKGDAIDLIEDDIISPDLAGLKARANVQTLQKLGILHRAAGALNKDNPAHSRFSMQLGTHRGRFTPPEKAFIGTVLPHVAKAMDVGRAAHQLALRSQGLLSAINTLTLGVCILDAKGRIVFANDEFHRQLDTYRILHRTQDGSLAFTRSEDARRFEVLKADAMNHGKFGARPRKEAIAATEDIFLCIEVAPLTNLAEAGSAPLGGFVVYSTDTSRPIRCATRPLQTAYGLTDTELEIVDAICEGLTNAQIAGRRDRSVATINAQVKSILSKTGCSTRTQFVRLMMSFGCDYIVPR